MGKKAIESARIFVEETGISDSLSAEQFLVEREDMLEKLFPTSEPMPGMQINGAYLGHAWMHFLKALLRENKKKKRK